MNNTIDNSITTAKSFDEEFEFTEEDYINEDPEVIEEINNNALQQLKKLMIAEIHPREELKEEEEELKETPTKRVLKKQPISTTTTTTTTTHKYQCRYCELSYAHNAGRSRHESLKHKDKKAVKKETSIEAVVEEVEQTEDIHVIETPTVEMDADTMNKIKVELMRTLVDKFQSPTIVFKFLLAKVTNTENQIKEGKFDWMLEYDFHGQVPIQLIGGTQIFIWKTNKWITISIEELDLLCGNMWANIALKSLSNYWNPQLLDTDKLNIEEAENLSVLYCMKPFWVSVEKYRKVKPTITGLKAILEQL